MLPSTWLGIENEFQALAIDVDCAIVGEEDDLERQVAFARAGAGMVLR